MSDPGIDRSSDLPKTHLAHGQPGQRSRFLDAVVREAKRFGTLFLYLTLIFTIFTVYQWVVLANNKLTYVFYGASIINAAILAKVMHVAEAFHLGERFRDKPLIYPVVYKSFVFGFLLVFAYVIEETVVGWLKGESLESSIPNLGGGTPVGILAVATIMCVSLVPFFAFKEMRRVLGCAKFDALVFKRGSTAANRMLDEERVSVPSSDD